MTMKLSSPWQASSFAAFIIVTASLDNGPAQSLVNWSFPAPTSVALNAVAMGDNQVQISFTAEPGVTNYVVESSPDLLYWAPVATNSDANSTRQLTADAGAGAQFFRARRDPIPILRWAIAANGNINMNGDSATTDSYNSADPSASTDGQYDVSKFGSNGCIASVEGVINLGLKSVLGDVDVGPTATFSSGTNQVTGTVHYDAPIVLPDVALPKLTWWMAPVTNGVHHFTTVNTALINTFKIYDNYPIIVEPGVQVLVKFLPTSFSAGSIQILGGSTNAGTLIIYQVSGLASFSHTNFGSDTRPTNFWYFGLPGVSNITMDGLAGTGVIYAPEAAVTAYGGALGPGFSGALVARSVTINAAYMFHFDESLLSAGPTR